MSTEASASGSARASAHSCRGVRTKGFHVFDAARKGPSGAPVSVVYASSAAVFGDNLEMPLTEKSAVRPISAYGADKLGCELHGRVAWHVHKVPNVGLRFFNVYGPRQDPRSPYSGVISIFADRVIRDRELTIFGDGGQTRDFIYVGDVCDAFETSLRWRETTTAMNLCTGCTHTLYELAETILKLIGDGRPILAADDNVQGVAARISTNETVKLATGKTNFASLAEGLAPTIEWYAHALRGG